MRHQKSLPIFVPYFQLILYFQKWSPDRSECAHAESSVFIILLYPKLRFLNTLGFFVRILFVHKHVERDSVITAC